MTRARASATAVVAIQLGSPDEPTPRALRRYLREFLGDPRVIDLPALPRWLLLNCVILPFRPRRSAHAYQQIWTEAGSPLVVNSEAFAAALADAMASEVRVELGMTYGAPSLRDALERAVAGGAERIVLLPLFPQYSEATTGSALALARELLAGIAPALPVLEVGAFFDDPGFIGAAASAARPALEAFGAEHVLMSLHGLPERQVRSCDPSGRHCLPDTEQPASLRCCNDPAALAFPCYRAQSLATARALARALALPDEHWSIGFQSRLGRTPWIQPYTETQLESLAARGLKRLAVACPSFVADCLETLEEIGLRGSARWRELGGDELLLLPCVNASPDWVAAGASLVRKRLAQADASDSAASMPDASESDTDTPAT